MNEHTPSHTPEACEVRCNPYSASCGAQFCSYEEMAEHEETFHPKVGLLTLDEERRLLKAQDPDLSAGSGRLRPRPGDERERQAAEIETLKQELAKLIEQGFPKLEEAKAEVIQLTTALRASQQAQETLQEQIRALVVQWRQFAVESFWPQRTEVLDTCAKQLDALVAHPSGEKDTTP
jgi:hypothetical protein